MKIFNAEAPIYLQLRQHIEELILDKALQEEEAIPSIRVMSRDYKLNPITVGNALSSLVDEGILYKKRGVGMYVSPNARQLIIATRGKDFVKEKLEPVLVNARQLEVPKEELYRIIDDIYGGKDE